VNFKTKQEQRVELEELSGQVTAGQYTTVTTLNEECGPSESTCLLIVGGEWHTTMKPPLANVKIQRIYG
jgi:hypothetical protein